MMTTPTTTCGTTGGFGWCHVTVHKPDSTAERLRFSLKTRDIEKARARRDKIFASIQQHFGIAA